MSGHGRDGARRAGAKRGRAEGGGADPTREAAFAMLERVLAQRVTLEEALSAEAELAPRDRAAAHRIAASVLRRGPTLDAVLERHLAKAPPERIRIVLRIGAASLLLLDTPPHAAVATAVGLTRTIGLGSFSGLVNAVLRKVADEPPDILDRFDGPRLDTPAWLWRSWGARARAIAMAHQQEASIDLSLRPGAVPPEAAIPIADGTVRLPAGSRITGLDGFETGAFWVQDVAASLPARLFGDVGGRRIVDLCAAPGGKTAQLALAGARVTAIDRDGRRLGRLRENVARLGLSVEIVEADALTFAPDAPFDGVLLDAPCSATGTIRRHPEIMRLRREADIAVMAERQFELLMQTRRLVRTDGSLVYAVCSMQAPEGPGVVERAIATGRWRLAPIDPAVLGELAFCVTPDGTLRTDPALWSDRGGMDGFFAARLEPVG